MLVQLAVLLIVFVPLGLKSRKDFKKVRLTGPPRYQEERRQQRAFEEALAEHAKHEW